MIRRWPILGDESIRERRWKRLAVASDFLLDLCKVSEWMTVRVSHNAVASDAHLVKIEYDACRDTYYLVIESESYPPLAEGEPPQLLDPPMWARWYGPGLPDSADQARNDAEKKDG